MQIWIDGYEANVKQRLGSSQVAFELIKNLEKIDKKNDYTILLPEPPLEDFPEERFGWKYEIIKPKKLWTRIALPLALYFSKQKPDLFFSPTHYIPKFSSVKKIVTIFDLSFLHFPEMFNKKDLWQLSDGTKFSIEHANKIITISNFSKKDIISKYKIGKDKIIVAYPGFDKKIFRVIANRNDINNVLKKYNLPDSYIIYIGTIQPRKNLPRLIEAVSRIKDITLVIVGKTKGEGRQGWMFEESLEAPKKFGVEDKVKFLNFVPTKDLPYLISGAKALIQPSLWEGFGIPVVEVMACGTPVIVSEVSSLPEVAGNAGILVNPYSIDQIEQAIRTIISDIKLQKRYKKAGLKQSGKFSWAKMARIVLKTFEATDKKNS